MLRRILAASAVMCLALGAAAPVAMTAMAQGGEAPKATRAAWFKHQPWNTNDPAVKKTGTGLEYVVIASGPASGATARRDQAAQIWYEGRLNSGGPTFDSSFRRGAPDVYGVSELVPGFSEALTLMRPGDRWLVYIPSQLAYGARGYPGLIGPDENLLFEILMVSAAG
jgi:FKBP-type peptidyl-prolyl cis-trans isomerase